MAQPTEAEFLRRLPDISHHSKARFWVAYSGGLDSQVLLDLALKTLPASSLRAIHVHHGLNAQADQWQQHCENFCASAGIELVCQRIHPALDRSSLEQEARRARYAAFAALLQADDFLLMAHHQDDQLETMLLHLFRGSGIKGLRGIPTSRDLPGARLLRPLLDYTREDLLAYARQHRLEWIEDSSNEDRGFDRNYLRHDIVPLIKQRWPGAARAAHRSAMLNHEADHLLGLLAQADLGMDFTMLKPKLPLGKLKTLEESRQRNTLRYWFAALAEQYALPAPGFEELRRLVAELIPAPADARPLITWSDSKVEVQARRYRDTLYVLKNFPAQSPSGSYALELNNSLLLPANLGRVRLQAAPDGLAIEAEDRLEIRFGDEAGSVKPRGRKTRTFKKIYQDYGVPPWLRQRIPLLFVNEELAAVGDLFMCADQAAKNAENSLILTWERADIHCGY